jgi:hypothetical protein
LGKSEGNIIAFENLINELGLEADDSNVYWAKKFFTSNNALESYLPDDQKAIYNAIHHMFS